MIVAPNQAIVGGTTGLPRYHVLPGGPDPVGYEERRDRPVATRKLPRKLVVVGEHPCRREMHDDLRAGPDGWRSSRGPLQNASYLARGGIHHARDEHLGVVAGPRP